MKVGILTMHRVRNWGSFLQAFALKQTVEELGYECSFFDIKPGVGLERNEILDLKKERSANNYIKSLLHVVSCCLKGQIVSKIRSISYRKRFNAKYDNEFLPMLGVNRLVYEDNKSFDTVIIGSDEVFNCTQKTTPWRKTLHLFGEGINAQYIITYAASFGYTAMRDLETHKLKDKISKALRNISRFSVRDMNSCNILEQLTGIKPELCIDPVLLFDFNAYMPKTFSAKDYLIVYTYQGRIHDPNIIKAIKEFASRHNKVIISLYCYYDWCDQSIIPDTPFELLTYFAKADYVVTDTFHGTVFSIKYNRNFCTLIRDSNAHKLEWLLEQFKLTNRIAKTPISIKDILEQQIDYVDTNIILNCEIAKAKYYLKDALSCVKTLN